MVNFLKVRITWLKNYRRINVYKIKSCLTVKRKIPIALENSLRPVLDTFRNSQDSQSQKREIRTMSINYWNLDFLAEFKQSSVFWTLKRLTKSTSTRILLVVSWTTELLSCWVSSFTTFRIKTKTDQNVIRKRPKKT